MIVLGAVRWFSATIIGTVSFFRKFFWSTRARLQGSFLRLRIIFTPADILLRVRLNAM